ncbi:MAG: hypothetical protein JRJ39_09940 [Deltaproteobacteria bacterium]|nr:hypothetical protein [Deltaproteobacteria bacterium]
MADKEKPMILSFNTVYVVAIFIFTLGVLHATVQNGVKKNTDDIVDNAAAIKNLKQRVESDSRSIYLEIKTLSLTQAESNRQDAALKKDVEWIQKGQQEIKALILKSK